MPRLCERPGCSTPADVAYGFDADTQVVWLDAFEAAQGSRAGALCRRHADAMVVPLGWMLDDRRDPVPRLFNRARMDDLTDGMARPKARRARSDKTIELLRSAVLQLTLDELSRDELVRSGGVHELDPATPPTRAVEATEPVGSEVASVPAADLAAEAAPEPAPAPSVVPLVPLAPAGLELDQSGPMAIVLALVGDDTGAIVRPEVHEEPQDASNGADEGANEGAAHVADDASEDPGDAEAADGAQVLPWQPRFDTEDDLKGLLKPRGRLLSRAFRGITADGA
jgi:hypothetical protein